MKHLLVAGLLLSCPWARGQADNLGPEITLMPPAGWESTSPSLPNLDESPFATLKYVPKDGRNAVMIVTLLPAGLLGYQVADWKTLHRFSLAAIQPHVGNSRPNPIPVEFTLNDGIGVHITAESPRSPGTPRFTTVASALVGSKYLIHCAIFHDGPESTEFVEAFQALLSARRAAE